MNLDGDVCRELGFPFRQFGSFSHPALGLLSSWLRHALSPDAVEGGSRESRVANRVTNRAVTQPVLERPCGYTTIGQGETASVTQLVWRYWERNSSPLTCSTEQFVYSVPGQWATALGGEYEGASVVASQST